MVKEALEIPSLQDLRNTKKTTLWRAFLQEACLLFVSTAALGDDKVALKHAV
jgi:hypothetical protein